MKIKQLTEGISSILYHATSLDVASKIISQDEFRLTTTYANTSELSAGSKKLFFLSTTRSKSGGYTVASTAPHDAGNVVLVLDGQALSHNYTGDPVEFWGREFLNISPAKDEMEDRVYNDEPTIPNASRYIKAIHILFKDKLNQRARNALLVLKRSGIPVWLYQDQKAYLLQVTSRAKSISDFTLEPAEPGSKWSPVDRNAYEKQKRRREKKQGGTKEQNSLSHGMARWIKLMVTPVEQYDSLGQGMQSFISRLQYKFQNDDAKRSLEADLHNEKSNPYWINKLHPIMKRNRLRSASDILDFITKRWAPMVND